eukprot:TRINITY_DN10096_c0_g2_i1.p2 TRINITY_DN10096_c0_g2~~TRINITY_DN10096_c0_g2_i1.p2  ORF type:complete len:136 (+),score=29.72 TRINITY_DN10096_c0_g2_i1:37-444(+)
MTGMAEEAEPTLQDAFNQFRKRRQKERRKAQKLAASHRQRSQEEMMALRQKFVKQVESYIGIPYSRKYHQDPSSEHYDAPLYLDCCGLVRRAVQDLADDFGFQIGRWNQAYQASKKRCDFDTHGFDKHGFKPVSL